MTSLSFIERVNALRTYVPKRKIKERRMTHSPLYFTQTLTLTPPLPTPPRSFPIPIPNVNRNRNPDPNPNPNPNPKPYPNPKPTLADVLTITSRVHTSSRRECLDESLR